MLVPVQTSPASLEPYRQVIEPALWKRIDQLAKPAQGLRVVHINATPAGGGVAEILQTLIPLMQAVGVDARWYVLPPDGEFFNVTKHMHNWLQGRSGHIRTRDKQVYQDYSERVAAQIRDLEADVWVVHDPQPLPLRSLAPLSGPSIWRCHIDSSTPNGGVCRFLMPWVREYDRAVFTMPSFCMEGLTPEQVVQEYPAIDPFAPKNLSLPPGATAGILEGLGVDPHRPLVTQVSRFDAWKNPWEAVDSYRIAKREIPELQLALVGVFAASDDPEAPRVYRSVQRYVSGDPDVHLFSDPRQVGAREINAFQSGSAAILQRSTREGFALTVTEAMWKGTPVIGTPVGGIVMQIQDGENGFLAESAEECAERIVELVRDPAWARVIGEAAQESVRQRFLMPRLLADELELYGEVATPLAQAA